MATEEEIFDFEGAIEPAIREALYADRGIRAVLSRQKGVAAHQFIGARLIMGQAQGHCHQLEENLWVEDIYAAQLVFYIRTRRQAERGPLPSALHGQIRASVRVFMLRAIAKVNAQLTLHALASEFTPSANSIEYSEDQYDITEVPYQISIRIKPDAWPA